MLPSQQTKASDVIGSLSCRCNSSCNFHPGCLYTTLDSFVPFCQAESNCFDLAVCKRERIKYEEWSVGVEGREKRRGEVWGTEIINARLPATPHYSVGALFFSAPLHRKYSHDRKQKTNTAASLSRVVFSLVLMRYTVQIHG